MHLKITWPVMLCLLFFSQCRKISESYPESEPAIHYQAANLKNNPIPTDDIRLMSWNIRFGIGRSDWFGDACGLNTIYSKTVVEQNLKAIVSQIRNVKPDVLMVQECDRNSKRTEYTDEISYILENTDFNHAYYAPAWQSQFIPNHGLGKMDMGIVIFSKWPLEDVQRISLPQRADQSTLVNYFYINYCMLKGTLTLPGYKPLVLFNLHSLAFTTDDTKRKHYEKIKSEFDKVNDAGLVFACGGDFNTLPPGSVKTDYCLEDMCEGESFHISGKTPEHKEGSNYTGESEWVMPIFDKYKCSLPLSVYLKAESLFFTHTTRHPYGKPDRRLDYFFTNYEWVPQTDTTYQDAMQHSDHAPISVKFKLPQ
jgi:endonuclease/exonuclease/phosphatase family metal-dependent hydrolase